MFFLSFFSFLQNIAHFPFYIVKMKLLSITETCLYNIDPLKPHFYIVKLGFTGVDITFLISAQKHRLCVLVRAEAVLTSTHTPCLSRYMKKYQNLYLKFFIHSGKNFSLLEQVCFLHAQPCLRRVSRLMCLLFRQKIPVMDTYWKHLRGAFIIITEFFLKDRPKRVTRFQFLISAQSENSLASRKLAYIILTPLNPTFI